MSTVVGRELFKGPSTFILWDLEDSSALCAAAAGICESNTSHCHQLQNRSGKYGKPLHDISVGMLDAGLKQTRSKNSMVKCRGTLAHKQKAEFKSKLSHEVSREVLS